MSELWVNTFKNENGNGAPDFPNGITITGVATATTLNANVTGDLTVSGDIGCAGTITYEDVARIDATGISTFREGFKVGPLTGIALTTYNDGSIRTSGIVTAASFVGDGSGLTGAGPSLANGSNNRVITATGANALTGEANLTFDGSDLTVLGEVQIGDTSNHTKELRFADSTRVDASSIKVDNGSNADLLITNDRGSGSIRLATNSSERLRVGSAGQLGIGGANYGSAGQVLKSGGASAAPAWGAIAAAKIGKVYRAETSANITTVSTSWSDCGLEVVFTPQAADSDYLILCNCGIIRITTNTTASLYTRITVNDGNVGTWGTGWQYYTHSSMREDRGYPGPFLQAMVVNPNTTSQRTVNLEWKAENTSGSGFYMYGTRTMTVMEIMGGYDT